MKDDFLLIGVAAVISYIGARFLASDVIHHAALAPNQPNCLAGDPNCKQNPKQPSPIAAPVAAAKSKSTRPVKAPTPHVAAAPGAVTIPYVPDTSCGGAPSGKPALNFIINSVSVPAELDSGATNAVLKPTTASSIKLTSLPKAQTQSIAFTGQAASTLQGYTASVGVGSLTPISMTIFTGPNIGCDLIPTQAFTSTYNITLSSTSATFVPSAGATV